MGSFFMAADHPVMENGSVAGQDRTDRTVRHQREPATPRADSSAGGDGNAMLLIQGVPWLADHPRQRSFADLARPDQRDGGLPIQGRLNDGRDLPLD
jgi:hypothetical protein